MASVYDETSKKTYQLIPNKPLILGRSQVNKDDQRISRAHVQITLLNDQRCFVKAMSRNCCALDNAILPRKINEQGQDEGQEVEAFNDQLIHLLPGKLYPLRLTLPKTMTTPTPRKPLMQQESEADDSEATTEQSDDSMNEDDGDIDAQNGPSYPSTPSSSISTESSLLGGESWAE